MLPERASGAAGVAVAPASAQLGLAVSDPLHEDAPAGSVAPWERAAQGRDGAAAEVDLIAVGAGAKAAAVAAKVHALNTVDAGPLTLAVFEANEPAASWMGRNGMTSGEEPLAITPVKDVGFPYQCGLALGEVGAAVDEALAPFSWQRYMIGGGGYARWVDAGSPPITHREYGRYLAWVLRRATAGVSLVSGLVTEISLAAAEEEWWVVEVAEAAGLRRYRCRALLLTGPGVHCTLSQDAATESRTFHCDSHRSEFDCIPLDRPSEIAIVGGGESALSSAMYLRASRPLARLTIYTPTLPMSRGESFLENRVFSNPDNVQWSSLDLATRRDFFKHCDRGVFDPASLTQVACDEGCRFVTGRVVHVASEGGEGGVRVDYERSGRVRSERYDYLMNCTGFDLLGQLHGLFPPPVQEEIERRVGPLWSRPPEKEEVPFGRFLELEGLRPRLHIPGLAALSQGPGFANLGCLGLLADRVLAPLVIGEAAREPLNAAIP
jgi:mycobactin lysine-N-oxygenase